MAQNENKVVELKKENIFKRTGKWIKSHGRDIALGTALALSIANTAILVMANVGGIEAEIQADDVEAAEEGMGME